MKTDCLDLDNNDRDLPRRSRVMHIMPRLRLLSTALAAACLFVSALAFAENPPSRGHFSVVYDAGTQRVVLMSGVKITAGQLIFFDDYWQWNGTSWFRVGNTALRVMGATTTYDAVHRRILLLGGEAERPAQVGELRALVGGEWVTLGSAPELKGTDPGLAIDSVRSRVVAFVPGPDGGKPKAYEWDGKVWRPGKGKPPVDHNGARMVYDPKRGVIVLFGGHGVDKKHMADVWEYDGLKWSEFYVPGPAGRSYAGMVYDDKLGAVVIHGGMGDGAKWLNDTWSWDGKEWKQLSANGPALELGMAYDIARDRLVVVGTPSHENNEGRMQTWEFDGTSWKKVSG